MKNTEKTLGALAIMPFKGAVFDEEPHPVGEVIDVEEVPLIAKRLRVRIQDRRTGDVKNAALAVVYADHIPVICEIEEMADASDEPAG